MPARIYVPVEVDYTTVRATSQTIPDQSLSINEIVARFTRGIPVDTQVKRPVYADQNDYDLEKLSRMDFAEKAQLAGEMRENAEQRIAELRDAHSESNELANEDEEQPKSRKRSSAKKPSDEQEDTSKDKP